jgi:glutamine amidotransferase
VTGPPIAPPPLIAVLDYGMGNRRSVEKALEHVGARALITADPALLADADGLVVPGVGAFPAAMRRLRADRLDELIRAHAASGRPLLGICLGMQLLFDGSEELEPCVGLGLIPGEVRWLHAAGLRLPHIGWNNVIPQRPSQITAALPPEGRPFYHVHSLVPHPAQDEHVIATAEYRERFATIVSCGNVYGTQFHPEKSSRDGLALLAAFAGLCRRPDTAGGEWPDARGGGPATASGATAGARR